MTSILAELERYDGPRARIFSVKKLPDGTFQLREECDGYFTAILTSDELRQLGQELIDLASSANNR